MALPEILSMDHGQVSVLLYILVVMRAAWFLPDWLTKWQRLIDRRRETAHRARLVRGDDVDVEPHDVAHTGT
jgi:hypothetical protein